MKLSPQKNLRPLVAPWLLAMLVACILPSTGYGESPGAQFRRRADAYRNEARNLDRQADALQQRRAALLKEARRRQEQARQSEERRRQEERRRSGSGYGVRMQPQIHDSWTPLYQEADRLGREEQQIRNHAAASSRQAQGLYEQSRRADEQEGRRRREEEERRNQEALERERQAEIARRQQQERYGQTGGPSYRTIRPGTCFIDSIFGF